MAPPPPPPPPPPTQPPTPHTLTPTELHTLATAAIDAKSHAYCPYSNFRVGAAILVAPGSGSGSGAGSQATLFTGANVEIAASPVGTCAERCALAALVASVARPAMPVVRAVAVASDVEPPASPCGMCRQFMREFCGEGTPVFMFGKGEDWEKYEMKTIGELLPMSFGPDDMDRNRGEK